MIKKFINNEEVEKWTVSVKEMEGIKVENVLDMLLMSDDGVQAVSILVEDDQKNKVNYLMRATQGYEISNINQLIRSFDLGITVEFVDFIQYDLFIDYCMNLIRAKRKATA
jgi:hypothetical protein